MDDEKYSKIIYLIKNSAMPLIILLIFITSIAKSMSIWNYSHLNIDEEALVNYAVGFLDYDFNPRWFGYHTLPMYILYAVYQLIYFFYLALGYVSSITEFASFLFSNDKVFFVTARLVCSIVYTSGVYVLAHIIWKKYNSRISAILFFVTTSIIPDSLLAANEARVDSFVFMFLALTVYFSCFTPKNGKSFALSTIFAAAAFCCKFPAIVVPTLLFIKLILDVSRKEYPKKYLLYFIVLSPVCVFVFMPYAFLDFAHYQHVIMDVVQRSSGSYYHIGKTHFTNFNERLFYIYTLFMQQISMLTLAGTILFAVHALFKREYIFSLFFVFAYASTFSTSLAVDSHWYRPIYPFLIFFTFLAILVMTSKDCEQYAFIKKHFNANISAYVPCILSLLLCITYVFSCKDSISKEYHLAKDSTKDTRILSNEWIEQNIPSQSRIWLEGYYVQYFPKVFAADINIDYALRGSFTPNTKLVDDAFSLYYYNRENCSIKYDVNILGGGKYSNSFFERLRLIKPGDFVITSDYVYDRYYDESMTKGMEVFKVDAQKYYAELRKQTLIAVFKGKGPIISIYFVKDDFR